MDNIQIIQIFIAIVALLGGFFGIPKFFEAMYLKRQKSKIKNGLKKLEKELAQIDKGDKEALRKSSVFTKLKTNLWEAKNVLKNKEFLQVQLDGIIKVLYRLKMYDYIQQMRAKFENHFEFSPYSWAYIAISNMNLYRFDGMNEYREYSLEACKEASKRLPNYGSSRAVVLIIHMIDHLRNKQIDKDAVRDLINQINSGDDTLVPYETYDYLNLNKQIKAWEKYVDELFNLFPKEMTLMENKYTSRKK